MKFKGEQVSFLGWLDNVWYHYKTVIIIGTLALILITVGMVQMLSKEDNDVFFYCIGEYGLIPQERDMFVDAMVENFPTDSDGNGKCVVDIKIEPFKLEEDEMTGKKKIKDNAFEGSSLTQRFDLEIMRGDCIIYIMDPAYFHSNLKFFASLEEELGYVPENAIEGKGIKLSDLDFYWQKYYDKDVFVKSKQTSVLGYFPEDYIICLADRESRYKDGYYEGNVEFFKKLVEFKHVPEK